MEYINRSARYRLLPRTQAKHQKLWQVTGTCVWVSKYRDRSVMFPETICFKIDGNNIRLQKLGWYGLTRRGDTGRPVKRQEIALAA